MEGMSDLWISIVSDKISLIKIIGGPAKVVKVTEIVPLYPGSERGGVVEIELQKEGI
jgi:hypothetical protein